MFMCKTQIQSDEDLEHISALIVSDVLFAAALSSTDTSSSWKEHLAKNRSQNYSHITVREKKQNSENRLEFA